MDARQTVNNLHKLSRTLSEAANKPENYNTDWAYYLEQISFDLAKQANELSGLMSLLDVSSSRYVEKDYI